MIKDTPTTEHMTETTIITVEDVVDSFFFMAF
jgi:hypothetical protein